MKLAEMGSPVEKLSGVGAKTAGLFARQGIFTVADLLSSYPRDYEDRTRRIPIRDWDKYPKIHTVCKVLAHSFFGYGKMKTLKLCVADGTGELNLVAFNRPFLEKSLPEGCIISLVAQCQYKYGELQATAFEASRLAYDGELSDWADVPMEDSEVIPIYPLTEGLSNKLVRKAVAVALKQFGKAIDDELPASVIGERGLLHLADAVEKVHRPKSLEEAQEARRTIIYGELYAFEYKMARRALAHRGYLPVRGKLPSLVQLSSVGPSGEGAADAVSAVLPPAGLSPQLAELPSAEVGRAVQTGLDPSGMPSAASSFTTIDKIREEFEKSLSPRQKDLLARLPFALTADQMAVIAEMGRDIDRSETELNTMLNAPDKLARPPFSMQRLLQGDVGSGKTLVSFFVCLRTVDYGGQCALMAPTELLASQHAENAARLLEPLGIRVAFLTGNVKSSGRKLLLKSLAAGEIDIVIGTHALFARDVVYKKLCLAVIDEQHRFGVAQRDSIVAKGRVSTGEGDKAISHSPDLLMMSATPIPQTLALTVFGDLDVSTIKSMPLGRKPVRTYLTVMGHESNVYEAVRRELEAGRQAYFVYPRIGEGGEDGGNRDGGKPSVRTAASAAHASSASAGLRESEGDGGLKSAEMMFEFLSTQVYPGYRCAMIHGKLDEEGQHQILTDFRDGTVKVLVATTVVEVGVDVPNATCIVIEHADRFGLSELHQLRGRVGRGQLQSYCFLIYGRDISEDGKQRMKALHESTDGFKIAEADLKLRGPGEILGTEQSGYLSLGLADLVRDKELLALARSDAFRELERELPGTGAAASS
ncbi:MAG: ATP-dependent DNA helicase RecG [Treponema sp.]|nr:ATP-dependent DNA helicase RecG [Treponema sp.]